MRYALAEFDLGKFQSSTEDRRQISVRLPASDKTALAKVAKKQQVSLGEILRAAVDALPDKKPVEKKAVEKKAPEKKVVVKKGKK